MRDDNTNSQTKPQRPSVPIELSSRSFIRRVLVPLTALIVLFLMLVMPSCQPILIVIAMTDDKEQLIAQEGA